jgi:hypothetical protein
MSHDMGGLGAACVAIIPAGLAAKWWRQVIVLAIVGGVIWVLFLSHSK